MFGGTGAQAIPLLLWPCLLLYFHVVLTLSKGRLRIIVFTGGAPRIRKQTQFLKIVESAPTPISLRCRKAG